MKKKDFIDFPANQEMSANVNITAIEDFEKLGVEDERFKVLYQIVRKHNGMWCAEAEAFLLGNFNYG